MHKDSFFWSITILLIVAALILLRNIASVWHVVLYWWNYFVKY